MNDTQSVARQRSGSGGPNQNYGSQRQGNYSGNTGGGGGYNNNQYGGPPSSNYNSYGGNNYQIGGGSGVKREI